MSGLWHSSAVGFRSLVSEVHVNGRVREFDGKTWNRQKLTWQSQGNLCWSQLMVLPIYKYYVSYNHMQGCVIFEQEIGNPFQKPTLYFFNCPLSTIVKLKIVVITHKFQGIESISMQMIPSHLMRLTDLDNVVYYLLQRTEIMWDDRYVCVEKS